MKKATMSIGPLLRRSIKKNIPQRRSPNWRINNSSFILKTAAHEFEPGSVVLSPGWFVQGHAVSF